MQNNYEEKVSMIHIKFKIWVRKKRKIYAYINRVKSHYDQRKKRISWFYSASNQ
jgi:hypothetical protein